MPERYDHCVRAKVFQVSLRDENIISEIDDNLSSARILDVGCATGRLLCKLAVKGAGNLSGVDIAPNIIKAAQQKLRNSSFEADLRIAYVECALPWADRSFDYIVLSGAIHHLYRPTDALKEIHRVMEKGAKLIIAEPWFPQIIRHILNLWLLIFSHDGDYHFYSPRQLIRLISTFDMYKLTFKKVALLHI
jgi:ubiquinone/menaquinone biosynthesis C-methylase UbiE